MISAIRFSSAKETLHYSEAVESINATVAILADSLLPQSFLNSSNFLKDSEFFTFQTALCK